MKQTKEDLRLMNGRFIGAHGELTQSDYDMIERYQSVMERNHNKQHTPQPGDRVEGAYYDGLHPYKYGLIDSVCSDGTLRVCYQPMIPFISSCEDGTIRLSVSGGPFGRHKPEEFVLVEEESQGMFCRFGHNGACADGAVNFEATVRHWRIPYEWRCKYTVTVLENPPKGRRPIFIENFCGMGGNTASFGTMRQLDRFCETIGVTYALEEEREGYKRYRLSHDLNMGTYFWKLEELPEGCTPIMAFCNGIIVRCYFLKEGHEVKFFKPNPNAKEVYQPLPLEAHINHASMYGYY